MPFDTRELRRALGCFATGVTIITTVDREGRPWGFTANSFTALSLDPPLVLFCLDRQADCFEVMEASPVFAINILSAEQEALSRQFATKGLDKFQGIPYQTQLTGAPLLPNTLAFLECRTQTIYPGGDHHIYIGQVEAIGGAQAGEPLLFFKGKYGRIGEPVKK